jgi:hypothetical protein
VEAGRAESVKGGCTHYALSRKTLALPLPLGKRLTLDVDEACEINVKGIMALLLAQQ